MTQIYDQIGLNYANLRAPDPKIAKQIEDALGDAQNILNVGAGAGSYEPTGREMTAIEPSLEMIEQRAATDTRAIQGTAEDLPFNDDAFDASMATMTIHHWTDQAKGLREMRRVTKGKIVMMTFDPDFEWFWLADYFPALKALDDEHMPKMDFYGQHLGPVKISPVMIPHDCKDGFLAGYWRRPAAYLDENVRAAMSSFWKIGEITVELAQLETDLENGIWIERYGHLMRRDSLDCGYRLVETI